MTPAARSLEEEVREESAVARFYAGRSVLVTGASGFVGKVLLEKLLRACPDLGDVFVMLRPRKGRGVDGRLREILAVPVFDGLRRRRPGVLAKVRAVAGDVSLPGLGLAAEDRVALQAAVSVVFHVAATVRFDEHLRKAADTNVAGTRAVLDLCRGMANLEVLLHVSTAYCACTRKLAQELVYPPPMSACRLQQELAARDDAEVQRDTPGLIGAFPNTYTFTKAIAESVILEEARDLPVVIVRPSIVVPAWREPLPGWVDNWNGALGPWVCIGKGTLSCVFGRADAVADLVPVDVCVDLMVAAAWDAARCRGGGAGVTVYNCVTGSSNPVTWGEATALWMDHVRRRPYATSLGAPAASFTTSRAVHRLRTATGQLLPAIARDAVARVTAGKSLRLADQLQKQSARMHSLEFFTTRGFAFAGDNQRALWSRMSAADRRLLPFADVAVMDWGEYLGVVLEGSKTYMLREGAAAGRNPSRTRARIGKAYDMERVLPFLAIPLLAATAGRLVSKL